MSTYCNRCERPFVHRRAYQSHLEDSPRHHICFVANCDNDYGNVNHLRQHARDKHTACSDCEETFNSPSDLFAHVRSTLHVGRNFACACGDGFGSPAGILLHIENGGCKKYTGHKLMHLIGISVRKHASTPCKPGANIRIGKKSGFIVNPTQALQDEYGDHKRIAYHPKFRNYVCQYCLDYFDDSDDLERHLSNAEKCTGSIRYICDNCDEEFGYPSGLCQHYESRSC
ncbi:hypothetical protein TWF506_009212 [Arthrobotrys conoides]|uniref:C2H2-type domain-containing protein n=1 Tax=Arthrobotrys conoides TaxID=74498 RepID=A0AAN8NKH9_9PEZI